ncbi:MAG: DUF5606 domain-containing protein [Bacteroidales bacterium]|nr:DUF5606 domain-containing protein [Bacteroidales bacterium]
MDLSNILMIAGKPDLSELVSQTRGGGVVKSLVTGQKYSIFRSDRVSSLGDIRIFTDSDECPLQEVMQSIFKKLDGQPTPFDTHKAEAKEMFAMLAEVLPDYDRERVHASDVKKIFAWYNILLAAGRIDLEEPEADATEGQQEEQQA